MMALLIFAVSLLMAVLLSDLAGRTILSISVLFLIVGMVCSIAQVIHVKPTDLIVASLAEVALVSVLFTDAAKVGIQDLIQVWTLPSRALFLGMPLTLLGTAFLAHQCADLEWKESLLLGAVLSPTDPVFASALVNSEKISNRLKHLLNVESGVNDGLALPLVMIFQAQMLATSEDHTGVIIEIFYGMLVGILVPLFTLKLEKMGYFSTNHLYVPILGFAMILTVFSLSKQIHANEFLAAFTVGVTVASTKSQLKERLFRLSQSLGEIFKLAALFLFGSLISLQRIVGLKFGEVLFIILAIILVRPLALDIALIRSDLSWKERIVAGWFGPKGFASVVFGLMILNSEAPDKNHLFDLISLVVTGSIVLLSSTDILAKKWLNVPAKESRSG